MRYINWWRSFMLVGIVWNGYYVWRDGARDAAINLFVTVIMVLALGYSFVPGKKS